MKKIISFVLAIAMILGCVSMAFATVEPFTDAMNNGEVTILRDLGVLQGDGYGHVSLETNITRAEVCAILMRILGYEATSQGFKNIESGFTDVKVGTWYNGYITLAYNLGLVNGIGNKKFNPEGYVTYEEAVAFIVKALGYKQENLSLSWPYNFIVFAQTGLNFVDGSIMLGTVLTREQMFGLLYNAMDLNTVIYGWNSYSASGKTFAELASGKEGTVATIGAGEYTTGRAVVTKSMANNAANSTYGSVTVSKYVGKFCNLLYKNGQIMVVLGIADGSEDSESFSYNKLTGEIKYGTKSCGKTIALADDNAWQNFYINGDVAGKTSTEAINNIINAIKTAQNDSSKAIDSTVVNVIYAADGSIEAFAAINIWQRTASGIVNAEAQKYYKNGSLASLSAVVDGTDLKFKSKDSKLTGLTVEGEVSDVKKVAEGDVLTFYANVSNEITKIYVTREVVYATYEGFYKKALKTYYAFDGLAYQLSTNDIGQETRSLNENQAFAIENSSTYVGSQYALYLNRDGQIEAYKNLYDGEVPVTYISGYAVITKLNSTATTGKVGIVPVLEDMQNDIELYDLGTGELLVFEDITYEGHLFKNVLGQVYNHGYLTSTYLMGWVLSKDYLGAGSVEATVGKVQYVVKYTIEDGNLSIEPSDYEYKTGITIKKNGIYEGSKAYPYSSNLTVVCFVNGERTLVKDLGWLLTLSSFDGYFHVTEYGFVDQIIVSTDEEVDDTIATVPVAAIEAIDKRDVNYVVLNAGSNSDYSGYYYLDGSNPNVGDIFVNIPVNSEGVAQILKATNLKYLEAAASYSYGTQLSFASSNGYTNIKKNNVYNVTCNQYPEVWISDGENGYDCYSISVETAFGQVKGSTGKMVLYDLDEDSIVDFVVVYPGQ